ncbi:MAG: DegV family protein [Lachnospiraceae bacterium]|nr:DegV family protein [Lachnospiraceae bacterium]
MGYKIVVDSCGELTEEMKQSGKVESVPLSIQIENETIVDDDTFNQKDFLVKVARSPECPKSSCPSPERYMESYKCHADRIYVVTLSAELSGSYNSAVLGKSIYEEEHGEKKIHIFNSRSASVGETLIAQKIMECEENGLSFEQVIEKVDTYIQEQNTYFVLETLETLKKNGRLTGVKALVASALNIKPIMASTPQGTICQLGKSRGINKALDKMVACVMEKATNTEDKTLAIAHCNCYERAVSVKKELEERGKFKEIIILDTRGISTMYASDGGIIVVV